MALNAQHTIAAMLKLREEYLASHAKLLPWMTHVVAQVYRNDLPLQLRQLLSGSDQNRQGAVAPVLISRVVKVYLDERRRDPDATPHQALIWAIAKTGGGGRGRPRT